MQASACAKSGMCFARYELNIGNTGSTTQDKVVAVVHVDPAKWMVTHRVQDLAGDRPRAADPRIMHVESERDVVHEIDQLVAGANLIFTLDCHGCSIDEIRRAKETPISIQAAGKILQGEPRVTTLARRLKLLFAF